MKTLQRLALVLVIIGALNWGLIGFFRFDLVAAIFGGQTSALSRIIYALVGLSGLACLPLLFQPVSENEKTTNRQGYGNLNYGTEFAEENDLSKLNESSRSSYDNPTDKK